MTTKLSYKDGVATIITAARESQVNVPATAQMYIDGRIDRPSKTDVLALSIGYRLMDAECQSLRAELEAARAGRIGFEHAEAMQYARKMIAELNYAAELFLAVYDEGNAPDGNLDEALRDSMCNASGWLISDLKSYSERVKILEAKPK